MKKYLLLTLLLTYAVLLNAQTDRKVLVLDFTNVNSESNNSRIYAIEHLMINIGVPYDLSTDVSLVNQYPVVIAGSRIKDGTLSITEINTLNAYVSNGGVLITSSLRETQLFATFGISSSSSNNALFELQFDVNSSPQLFQLIDDPLEKTISLGRASKGTSYYMREYTSSTGQVLGKFENNKAAFVHNEYGMGNTYVFGPDFRDLIYRNVMGLDVSAHRTYSNGFEPSTDVIYMIMRNIIRTHIPYTVYSHTVPSDAKSIYMVTHDIDSKTGYDTMEVFSTYEKNNHIIAQYNATTKYFLNSWNSYYPSVVASTINVLDDGHKVSSHSVGHWPDFASFNLGLTGATGTHYIPSHANGNTHGGSVLPELEISKASLENIPGVVVRTFRAGHLAFPDSLILGLQLLGYDFNSTHSANDVLTNFPYRQMEVRKYTTTKSSILEIPMTISDVFASDPINNGNYLQKVAIWNQVSRKYADNYSPINLLIHPNRNYKLDALKHYVNNLPKGVVPYNFEDYGDFWNARENLEFVTTVVGSELHVYFQNDLHPDQGFIADVSNQQNILFFNKHNQPISMQQKDWDFGQQIFYQTSLVSVIDNDKSVNSIVNVYPNPVANNVHFSSVSLIGTQHIEIYDTQGKRVVNQIFEAPGVKEVNLSSLPKGLYVYRVYSEKYSSSGKLIKQ